MKLLIAIVGAIQVIVPAVLGYLQFVKYEDTKIELAKLKASAHTKATRKHKKHHKK